MPGMHARSQLSQSIGYEVLCLRAEVKLAINYSRIIAKKLGLDADLGRIEREFDAEMEAARQIADEAHLQRLESEGAGEIGPDDKTPLPVFRSRPPEKT